MSDLTTNPAELWEDYVLVGETQHLSNVGAIRLHKEQERGIVVIAGNAYQKEMKEYGGKRYACYTRIPMVDAIRSRSNLETLFSDVNNYLKKLTPVAYTNRQSDISTLSISNTTPLRLGKKPHPFQRFIGKGVK